MGSFSYEATVGALDYDFTGSPRGDGQPGYCTGKGRVKEPSQETLEFFSEAMAEFRKDIGGKAADTADPEAQAQATADEVASDRAVYKRLLGIIATLCDGQPTEEELAQLPPRVFGAFANWLQSELFDPKG